MFGLDNIAALNEQQLKRERRFAKLRAAKRLPQVATNRYVKKVEGGVKRCVKLASTNSDEFTLRISRNQLCIVKVA